MFNCAKLKIFTMVAVMLAVVFSAICFMPTVASAKSFTLRNTGSVQKFAIEGKGGLFKKEYSFTVSLTGGSGNGQRIMTYADTTYAYRNIDSWPYIAEVDGRFINKGQTRTISFKGKGNMLVTLGLQKAGGSNLKVEINLPKGFSVRQL